MKLKKIYKELQKQQMSQLKETMKQQSSIAKDDDDNAAREDEQDASVEESTSAKPQVVDTPNHVTVDITMTTLSAVEVQVCVLEITFIVWPER